MNPLGGEARDEDGAAGLGRRPVRVVPPRQRLDQVGGLAPSPRHQERRPREPARQQCLRGGVGALLRQGQQRAQLRSPAPAARGMTARSSPSTRSRSVARSAR